MMTLRRVFLGYTCFYGCLGRSSPRLALAVTAGKLRIKAKQLAATAKEKEVVRRALTVTAGKLKEAHTSLKQKVRDRTLDLEETKEDLEREIRNVWKFQQVAYISSEALVRKLFAKQAEQGEIVFHN